ncbi:hypothetical protein CRM91_33060 [Burkholderia ambifaria]|nr:hypothetical protein CRM91_33060 [Burkholderia ambifaria]
MRRPRAWPNPLWPVDLPTIVACASIAFPAKPPFRACFILTTLLPRIVTVERPLRNARRARARFTGKRA